jgi:chloride channel protein, CIC family
MRRPIRRIPAQLRQKIRATLLLAAGVGAATGAIVALIDMIIVDWTWGPLSRRDDWWLALLPFAALALTSILLQFTRERSTETTEEYIRVFHDRRGRVRLRSVPLRLAASIATIGLGGSMGLEGPSIYAGAAIGDAVERRASRFLLEDDRKVLLIAGAAAGIAAIFKAPVTGIVFALEVPYRDDLARRALIPAMVSAATSYVVFASIIGTEPLFAVQATPLRLVDLAGAVLVGIACGLAARVFIATLRTSVRLARRVPFRGRALVAAIVVGGAGAASLAVFHRPFALGPGYDPILRAARGAIGPGLLVALLAMKIVATSATAAGNGVGGLFFPSVMMGAAVGGAVGHAVPGPASLFAVVGIAAFLGGAYKVPLAGVAFVAEATGAPGYIIPGLIAAAIAYLASGRASLSHRQRFRRLIDVESRLDVPVSEVMSREWVEVPPHATLHDFATSFAVKAKARTLPIANEGRYIGMAPLNALGDVAHETWDATPVSAIASSEHPTLRPSDRLTVALERMRAAGVDRAAVIEDGRIVGMLMTSEVLRVEQILDTVGEEQRRGLEM